MGRKLASLLQKTFGAIQRRSENIQAPPETCQNVFQQRERSHEGRGDTTSDDISQEGIEL
jgi:hypothetical protein